MYKNHHHHQIWIFIPPQSLQVQRRRGGEGESEEREEGDRELPYHTIVIDCAPIGFADSMGITVLEQVNVKKKDYPGISENLMVH